MRKVREGRKKKESTQNESQSMINNVEPVKIDQSEKPKRGILIKDSIEAKQYMTEIRSKKKQS